MSSPRSSIAARGVVAATVATCVALLSHVIGGGEAPGIVGVLVPLALSALVCVACAGQRASLLRLTVSVAVSQFLFHTLFVLGASGGASAGSAGTAAVSQPQHVHGGAPDAALAGLSQLPDLSGSHLLHAGAGMWLAHIVACLVTVAALFSAETVLSSVATLKRLILARLFGAVPKIVRQVSIDPLAPCSPDAATSHLPCGVFPSVWVRRGPPLAPRLSSFPLRSAFSR